MSTRISIVMILSGLILIACNAKERSGESEKTADFSINEMETLMSSTAEEPTRWRGPQSSGIYPDKELMKSWPADGPEILWSFEELGQGHSSAVIQNGFLYITGMIDNTGYLFKFDLSGELIYKAPFGIKNVYFVGAGLCVDFSFNGERDVMTFSHSKESVGFFSGGVRTLLNIKSCKMLEEIMVSCEINHKTKWL